MFWLSMVRKSKPSMGKKLISLGEAKKLVDGFARGPRCGPGRASGRCTKKAGPHRAGRLSAPSPCSTMPNAMAWVG